MTMKTMKAPTPARVDAIEMLSSADRSSIYPTFPILMQEPADLVGILAARSGVAAATVRAQLAAWRIGGGR